MRRLLTRGALPIGIATMLLATITAVPAQASAGPYAIPDTTPGADPITAVLDPLARELASSLAAETDLLAHVAQAPVSLPAVAADLSLALAVDRANQRVLRAKGLPATGGPVLRLRLAHPDMAAALARGETPVVVATPSDDSVTSVTGYDSRGRPVTFHATRTPDRPVVMLEVDVAAAMSMGLALVRAELAAHGLTTAPAPGTAGATPQAGYWATKITAVRLSDVKEPWFKGGAEIFSIVGGFNLNGDATVTIVDMPYLDDENKTYFPNQLLVHFNQYKYNLADVVMMEDDGGTNYQALAGALITALLTIADLGMYAPLVGPILDAIPGHWWTDDPDYVESWYTLATTSSGRLHGASGNGWMDVTPHWVAEL